ncbi:hypothetical protein [Leptolyngbya sp. PCC 6406]|uniref:hypothetical protein n=1 Tax=Leptolyngbya sp. PCC 6406 TaxID=1173264 RepID=UPI000305E72D|nr:hypothetical protein [Leptolyngbya sp. PCC 6406]
MTTSRVIGLSLLPVTSAIAVIALAAPPSLCKTLDVPNSTAAFVAGALESLESLESLGSIVSPDHQSLAQTSDRPDAPLETPPLPPLPETLPAPKPPAVAGILGLVPNADDDIGVGHLRPKLLPSSPPETEVETDYGQANWLQEAALPIYGEPGGQPWGWLINGWLVPNGSTPLAVGSDAAFRMLQTAEALFSFPVMEIREDGWFRFQYTPVGMAWAHQEHLAAGNIELEVETWQDRFLAVDRVAFRHHGISQSLRPSPNGNSSILALVGPDSFIKPLAFEGDWMQVSVTQPSNGCVLLPGARSQEGWIRWRNQEDASSLIWYDPQGC